MPDASTSLPKRKRGGQPGNRNRLIHGRYSKEEAVWREKMRGYRRKGKALVILVDNVLKARKALRRKLAARALAAAAGAQRSVPRRNAVSARASSRSDRVRTVSVLFLRTGLDRMMQRYDDRARRRPDTRAQTLASGNTGAEHYTQFSATDVLRRLAPSDFGESGDGSTNPLTSPASSFSGFAVAVCA